MTSENVSYWKKCSSCKRELKFGVQYWVCSVSTCNRKRTAMSFCSVACWESHVVIMHHRDSWAEERRAPTLEQWQSADSKVRARKSPVRASSAQTTLSTGSTERSTEGSKDSKDILVVVSKVKAYIKEQSGMNTSNGVMEVLSDKVREYSDAAISEAKIAERLTVMDRDY